MYTLYADGVVLFQSDISDSEYFLGKPEEKLDLGKVGSVSFTIYPSHPEYENIKAMITRIKVTKDDGKIVFIGRVLDVTKGTWNEKQCVCEDALGFLNDGFIPKMEKRSDITPHQFFASCIDAHNNSTSPDKHLIVGELRLDEGEVQKEFEIQSYSRVKNVIDSNLIDMYGGYLHLRYDDNDDTKIYVDYLQKFDQMGSQVIEFAKNLIELEDKMEGADIFTAMIATGKDHITIGDAVTSGTQNIGRDIIIQTVAGDPIIRIPEAIAKYGWIYRIEQFSSKETAADVLKEAKKYILNNYRKIPNTLSLKVVDMHLLNGSIDDIWIGKKYRIVSNPHGVDVVLLCTGINIDIQNPENTTYEFGDPTLQTSEATSNGSTSSSSGGGSSSLSGSTAGIGQACLWDGEDIDISKHEIILRAEENMLLEAKTMELKADLLVTDTNMAQVWTNSFLVMGGRLSQGGDGAYYDDQGRLILDADGKFAAGVDEAKYLVLKQAYELLHHVNPETGEEEPITFSALTTDVNLIGKNLTQAQMDILTNAEGIAGNRTMIDGHAATLTAINTDITNITSRVTTIGGDLDADELVIANQGQSITSIKSDITNISGKITNINSSITNINSDLVNIKGQLTASSIASKLGDVDYLQVKSITSKISGGTCHFDSYYGNHFYFNIAGGAGSVSYRDVKTGVWDLSLSTSNGTTTLKKKNYSGTESEVGSFKTADSVTVSGSWASGVFTAKASNGKSQQTETLTKGGETWSGTTCSFPVLSYINGNSYTARQTGKTFSVMCSSKLEEKSITTNGTYTPSSGKIGFSKVTVNVPNSTQVKNITSNGTYTPDSGYIGFNSVVVKVNTATEEKSITTNGTYTPSSGKIGFSKVTVNVNTSTETKTITSNGTYTPSSGKIGFSKVTVNITTHDTAVYNCVKGASQAKVSGSHFKGYAYYKSGNSYYKLYDYERYWYYSSSSNTPTTYYS